MDPAASGVVYIGLANKRIYAMEIKRIGLDLAKYVFEVHAVDDDERGVLGKTLRRDTVAQFFAALKPCIVGMEARCGSHHRTTGRVF